MIFMHAGNRAPAFMSALAEGPNMGLTEGYVVDKSRRGLATRH